MNNLINQLTVLKGLENNPLFSAFAKGTQNDFLYELYRTGAENDFKGRLGEIILTDENAFSSTLAGGTAPSRYLTSAFIRDLQIIFDAVNDYDCEGKFDKGIFKKPFDRAEDAAKCAELLGAFYKKHGYGQYIRNRAFAYSDGKLLPVYDPSEVRLTDLKDYEYEKRVFCDNLESFICGLPYSHTLLYGDRGTGKSSTVHAALNEYFDRGLRIIELNKENMLAIPEVNKLIARNPLKFIIFIDDLSLNEYDDKISSLKASLEGSVSSGAKNAMIVATSNRRHIIKENFSDRENSVHPSDSAAEQLSLSDRFGLTVMFSSTDKASYLSIVRQLAADYGLNYADDGMENLAERWALVKGGRSPRRARQFVDYFYSCKQRGVLPEF